MSLRDRPARPLSAAAAGGDGAAPLPSDAEVAAELRRLVLGHDRADLLDHWAQAGPEHLDAAALGDLLPDAVRLRDARDDALGLALEPAVEAGLRASVERDPQPIADILFPVMGPAIRRAVRHAVASSVANLNRTVNYGLSWRGLQWRVEAWRSGLTFGEVVLRHTLRYRVEQVLLVHRQTGLPLWHVVAPEVVDEASNADLVSAMLTALRQFVGDSFDVDEDDALDAFQVGDLSVWTETGPSALIASVVRGDPPVEFRGRMADALASIHARLAASFDVFDGDATPFETADETLQPLLDVEYVEGQRAGSAKLWALVALVLAVVGGLGWHVWDGRQREAAFLDALRAEPGVTVLRAEREGGRLVVVGAADPLARPPRALLPPDLDASDVELRFVAGLSPELAAARAQAVLDLPDGVALRSDADGRLVAEGRADTLWAPAARRLLPLLGVRSLDVSALRSPLDQAIADVEARVLSFAEGSANPVGLDQVSDEVARLARAADASGDPVVLIVEGHTDDVGTEDENRALSLSRALAVRRLLTPVAGALPIRAEGYGAEEAFETGVSPRSRRATFRIERGASPPPP